jgi:hypothetical protein
MSFQNYDSFQGQGQPTEEGGAPSGASAQQQQQPQMGQPIENSQAQFQGGNMGAPGSAGGEQSGDSKTTLWYV